MLPPCLGSAVDCPSAVVKGGPPSHVQFQGLCSHSSQLSNRLNYISKTKNEQPTKQQLSKFIYVTWRTRTCSIFTRDESYTNFPVYFSLFAVLSTGFFCGVVQCLFCSDYLAFIFYSLNKWFTSNIYLRFLKLISLGDVSEKLLAIFLRGFKFRSACIYIPGICLYSTYIYAYLCFILLF